MKKYMLFLSVLLAALLLSAALSASTIEEEIDRVAGKVAQLELGFGQYMLGNKITDEQKQTALLNSIEKSLQGTYKFQDGENFVIAANDDDIILGVYRHYPESTIAEIKNLVGGLMFEYGEPTATAHDKMIYWTFDDQGKINQDTFESQKNSGGPDPLATVKFSSSVRLGAEAQEELEPISAYLMITSDPLSKLFLASTKQ